MSIQGEVEKNSVSNARDVTWSRYAMSLSNKAAGVWRKKDNEVDS